MESERLDARLANPQEHLPSDVGSSRCGCCSDFKSALSYTTNGNVIKFIFPMFLASTTVRRLCSSFSTRFAKVIICWFKGKCDNDDRKYYKYVCVTNNQPDSKSNSNPNPNPNPTTKQHAIVSIHDSTKYSHIFFVSRLIHTRRCCCTIWSNIGCNCHTADSSCVALRLSHLIFKGGAVLCFTFTKTWLLYVAYAFVYVVLYRLSCCHGPRACNWK